MNANTLFPGRPDYVGPVAGIFGLLHHDTLCEPSSNVMERVAYVMSEKPLHQRATRLHNMIFLGDCAAAAKLAPLDADYHAKLAPLYADYQAKRAPLYADYMAKRAPLDADYHATVATLNADYRAKLAPLYADYHAKLALLDADYQAKLAPLDADYLAKRAPLEAEIVSYIRTHIPDCAWDGDTLRFGAER